MDKIDINNNFELAAEYVLHTSKNVFLTGKAGTGKTTFLKYIQQYSQKNTVVVAPTGVAAINAGGVTMHSFFQLPFQPFLPIQSPGFHANEYLDKSTLFNTIRFNHQKIALFKELELLIIDEVSMLRSDYLDCIDVILRHFRRKPTEPFGGVQVLFIGDMFQLPPIVKEWDSIKHFYETPFFFSAKVLEDYPITYIELKKIYRQSEQRFIKLLNRLRHNELNDEDYELLNERYNPEYLNDLDNYITLTTHNYKADKKNEHELAKLESDVYTYTATVDGDFPENMFPLDTALQLKTGAQIMFIKNDSDVLKRYYNGKLGRIKRLKEGAITIEFLEGGEIELQKEVWRNIKYELNNETNKINENEIGSFTQYPIRLAWAITIHKSQGLTFEKAIIDAGAAFAPGQVYVALSRCTNLDGLILQSRIHADAIKSDERILKFSEFESDEQELKATLELEKQQYAKTQILKIFNWEKLKAATTDFIDLIEAKTFSDKEDARQLAKALYEKIKAQDEVVKKFIPKLELALKETSITQLQELLQRAIRYFCHALKTDIVLPLHQHIHRLKNKQKVKQYLKDCVAYKSIFTHQIKLLETLQLLDVKFYNGNSFLADLNDEVERQITAKSEKGSSQKISFELYKQGNNIETIAQQRDMAVTTIEGHLAQFVESGDIDVFDFVTAQKVAKIEEIIEQLDSQKLTVLKEHLGNNFSFTEIKMALAHVNKK